MRFFSYFSMFIFASTLAWAQEAPEMEAAAVDAMGQELADVSSSSVSFSEEQVRLLKRLKEEVEPSLPPGDVKKLKTQIMRLGSYRKEWANEAERFLVENHALAELYIYDFSRIQNSRLNQRMIQVLMQFPSFQHELGPLAFSTFLSQNEGGRDLVLELFEHVVRTKPSVWKPYDDVIMSSWGEILSPAKKAEFLLAACESGAAFDLAARDEITRRLQSSRGFWPEIMASEVIACIRGA